MPKKIIILGGYGNTGKLVARLLAQETDLQVTIAGRSMEKANQSALEINQLLSSNQIHGAYADVSKKASLLSVFKDSDFVMVASSTSDYVHLIVEAALETDIDYLDIQLSSTSKLDRIYHQEKRIKEQGRCFITDGGFHPGVPGAMIQLAATKFEHLEKAQVSAAFQMDWSALEFSKSTLAEFVDELYEYRPIVYKEGQWSKIRNYRKIHFGDLFAYKYCTPMMLEELRTLPASIPSLQETGFYIAGFNWFTDYVAIPIAFAGLKLFGKKISKQLNQLFSWSLNTFSKPPYGAVLQLHATGLKSNLQKKYRLRLTHQDPYWLTAVPVVACLLQYFDREIIDPGIHFQAHFVEPTSFFNDLKRLGIQVIENIDA